MKKIELDYYTQYLVSRKSMYLRTVFTSANLTNYLSPQIRGIAKHIFGPPTVLTGSVCRGQNSQLNITVGYSSIRLVFVMDSFLHCLKI
jgi:hypothetical protein